MPGLARDGVEDWPKGATLCVPGRARNRHSLVEVTSPCRMRMAGDRARIPRDLGRTRISSETSEKRLLSPAGQSTLLAQSGVQLQICSSASCSTEQDIVDCVS